MKLTCTPSVTKIPPPRNIEVGFRSLFIQGVHAPQLKAVFLRQKFTHSTNLFSELSNVMVELFGQSLWLVSPCRDTANPLNSAANHFAVLCDGLTILSKGIRS